MGILDVRLDWYWKGMEFAVTKDEVSVIVPSV